jgi:hypothetical protein
MQNIPDPYNDPILKAAPPTSEPFFQKNLNWIKKKFFQLFKHKEKWLPPVTIALITSPAPLAKASSVIAATESDKFSLLLNLVTPTTTYYSIVVAMNLQIR